MSINYYFESFKKGLKKVNVTYFNSLNHLVDVIEDGYDNQLWNNKGKEERFDTTTNNSIWRWGEKYKNNIEKTKQMIRSGDIDESDYQKMIEILKTVQKSPEFNRITKETIKARKRRYSEEGDELDIDRLMSGNPEHWSKIDKNSDKPLYKICINAGASCGEGDDYFFNVVAVSYVISTIKTLENKSVEIDVLYPAKNSNEGLNKAYNFINLKKANESIDLKRICVPSMPSILRVYDFAVTCNILEGDPEFGLGQPIDYNNEIEQFQYDLIINADDVNENGLLTYIRSKI